MNSREKFVKVMDILNKYDMCNNTLNHSFFDKFKDEDFEDNDKISAAIEGMKALEERLENNPNKYSEEIMQTLRKRQGLDQFDTSEDEFLSEMKPDTVFNEVCNWNGLIRYDYTIKNWIKDIYGITLPDSDETTEDDTFKSFGTEEYGDQENFAIICKNCGRKAWAVPTHHYNDSDNKNPQKITFEFRCSCGKKFGATIHHNS